jgi:aspartate dehydrogenase
MKVCIIGCGFIGSELALAMEEMDEIEIVYVTDKREEKASALSKCKKAKYLEDIGDILNTVDLVIEAASQQAVRQYAPGALEKGKDMLVMSVGAFADEGLFNRCVSLAENSKCRIYIPTGACCGVDGLKSASMGRLEEVMLVSTKPISALVDNEFLKGKGIDLKSLEEPTTVFEGNAREAAKDFPKTANVAATLSLAGIGFEDTKVRIIANPNTDRNIHEVRARGEFGELKAVTSNFPSEKNPRTSILALLSAISGVKTLTGIVWIGL